MGAHECIAKGESKNKTKIITNGRAGHDFVCAPTDNKNSELTGMVAVVIEDYWGERVAKKWVGINC